MKQQAIHHSIAWNRIMSVTEFVVADSVAAINDELMERGIDPDQIISVFHIPGNLDRLNTRPDANQGRFRVLYRA